MSDKRKQQPAERQNSGSVCNLLESDTDITEAIREDDSSGTMGKSKGKVIENGCINSDGRYSSEMFLQAIDAVSISSNESFDSLRQSLSFKDFLPNEVNPEPSTSGGHNFITQVAMLEIASPLPWVEKLPKPKEDDDNEEISVIKPPEFSNQPSHHTRSLSQTTSQLENLKELADLKNDGVKGSHLRDARMAREKLLESNSANKGVFPEITSVRTYRELSFDDNDNDGLSLKRVDTSLNVSTTPDLLEIQRLEPNYEHFNTSTEDPSWKLDRRDSGHLYWRRDSSTLPPHDTTSNRVKFRYDIEVCEFDDRSSTGGGETTEDDDEVQGTEKVSATSHSSLQTGDSSVTSTIIVSLVAIIGIIITASYGWILELLHIL